MKPVITVEHLRKVYRVGDEKVVALNDIELEIGKGEMCCIVGASGSGKSTLLNQLAGAGKAHKGPCAHWQTRNIRHDRGRAGPVPPAASGLYFSKLQPSAQPDGGRKCGPAADVQGRAKKAARENSAARIKAHGPAVPRGAQAHRDVRRPATARGHCPRLCGKAPPLFLQTSPPATWTLSPRGRCCA